MRKPGKRAVAAAMLGGRAANWLARVPPWRGALVLAYHRIANAAGEVTFDPGVFSATAAGLDAQLEFLTKHFEVVSPAALERDPDSPGRRVVLTFDDGYQDNHELALPLLRRHGVTAAFFLATGFIDEPRVPWWDELAWIAKTSRRTHIEAGAWLDRDLPLTDDRSAAGAELARVFKSLETEETDAFLDHCADVAGTGRCGRDMASDLWMTWAMASELRDAGMTIGGHTVDHPVLARTDPERQRREIEECGLRLADELGVEMRYFAYPVGLRSSFDATAQGILADLGVRLAFSLYGGYSRPGRRDPMNVPRASVSIGAREEEFRAMLVFPRLFARW